MQNYDSADSFVQMAGRVDADALARCALDISAIRGVGRHGGKLLAQRHAWRSVGEIVRWQASLQIVQGSPRGQAEREKAGCAEG